jgi:hypothetical protein
MRPTLLTIIAAAAACADPCERLEQHARDCHFAESPYVAPEDSTCAAAEDELGDDDFDALTDCVTSSCDSDVSACIDEQTSAAADPCTYLITWAAACSLEPAGFDDSCAELRQTFVGDTFADWVECVTASGCPERDDDRFDLCQEAVLPESPLELIEACVLIVDWTSRCAGIADELPVPVGTDYGTCIAQAEPFTTESYLAFAQCQDAVECDDLLGRISCLDALDFVDLGPAREACARLVTYSATCGSTLGGDSVDACEKTFARFTAASTSAFVDCVEGLSCGDPAALSTCSPLLELL